MDTINLLIALGGTTILVAGSLFGIYVAIRRMQGHHSRFDSFFELIARAQGASVYPPSLRGNPDPQIEEDREVSRGDAAVRGTPGERLTGSDQQHTGAG